MEVLKSGDAPAIVSNIEVMTLLRERIDSRQPSPDTGSENGENTNNSNTKEGPFQNRDWIEGAVLNYLQASPCGGPSVKLDDMPKLVERLQREPNSFSDETGYGLTSAETLQVLNHLPTSPVELHLLVEDLENRPGFAADSVHSAEEKQMQFLKFISGYSGREVEGADAEDEGEEMEE
ncbi:hypothetical protein HJC23_006673 [Cyclotella cryptica]|uniref:DNA-directed RNA polymerase III subunit RPC9 n=1 Tax=Cyclotella cryptica TaxID=29204 RepID=A0ABD3QYU0_9STRA